MIGDLIPAGNEHWKLYQCVRKIVSLITSPTLSKGDIQNFEDLLQEHNALYFNLFGKLKPKMHIWLHYPRIMLLNGPVDHFSTLKYERKNRELKELTIATTSSINLPYTIAVRHQLNLCYRKETSII